MRLRSASVGEGCVACAYVPIVQVVDRWQNNICMCVRVGLVDEGDEGEDVRRVEKGERRRRTRNAAAGGVSPGDARGLGGQNRGAHGGGCK